MDIKRVLLRSWFYFRTGYGMYLSFPIGFIGFISTVYYLAVKNIPFLENLFPHFYIFILTGLLFVPPAGVLLGWMHFKRLLSPLYKAELDIQVESNPYATRFVDPKTVPLLKLLSELRRLRGIETQDLDKIIEDTEKKFGLGRRANEV